MQEGNTILSLTVFGLDNTGIKKEVNTLYVENTL